MTQKVLMVCEAKLSLEKSNLNSGAIEATVTSWGAREGADGRKFNYQPEGFMQWANEFSKTGKPLPMFLNHNSDNMPIGEWTSFEFTDTGMTASGRIYTNTSVGKDTYTIMKESPTMFGGVSVGAYAEEYQMVDANGNPDQSEDAYFQITKGGLREVSVVMYPNNPVAEVSHLEYFHPDGNANLKVLEKALRDAGLPKKDAVAAVSVFKKVLEKRNAPVSIENAPLERDADAEATTNAEILAALQQRELMQILSKRLKG